MHTLLNELPVIPPFTETNMTDPAKLWLQLRFKKNITETVYV